jgi:hypothetical protein
MLLLHELAQDPVVAAIAERVVIGGAPTPEDLASHVDERLDVGMELTAVLRLDVEDAVPVLHIGVVARDHGEIVAISSPPSVLKAPLRTESRFAGELDELELGGEVA